MQKLGLPYRVVSSPRATSRRAGREEVRHRDLVPEPGALPRDQRRCSNTTDFQARRLGIRYRGERGVEPVHTLNGTTVIDRMALAILENFQGEVPDVLRAYGAPERVTR